MKPTLKSIQFLLLLSIVAISIFCFIKLHHKNIQIGVRPYYLIDKMKESPLKDKLKSCEDMIFLKSDFSIAHRGAPLQFPEHSRESYIAAARMGAGIIECDVVLTKDEELVCRHSQCDLHSTTNILLTPLAKKCSIPFTPYDSKKNIDASAKCCTSDITLHEYKSLKAKMEGTNPKASSVKEYINATPSWRTDIYASDATLMSHKESIELFKKLGIKMIPELKKISLDSIKTRKSFIEKLLDEYKASGVSPDQVFIQSFYYSDIELLQKIAPDYAKQAIYLTTNATLSENDMRKYINNGLHYISPPINLLVSLDKNNNFTTSNFSNNAKKVGLKIVPWTFERSGLLKNINGSYYHGIRRAIHSEGDKYELLDYLVKDIGIIGIFSDWPATVTYYSNCMNK